MLSNIKIIIPLAAALFVLFWTLRWASIHRRAVPRFRKLPLGPEGETATAEALPETEPESEPAPVPEPEPEGDKRFHKPDWIALGCLTAVYAVVAFIGLGSNTAPQTFLHYQQGNTYALIELEEPQEITAIRYYSGLCTADYTLQFSYDGETWIDQVQEDGTSGMTQTYTQLFRWNDAVLNADNGAVRYIRIISGAEQYLGEVAIYGADGALIDTEELIIASGCEMLFDEQDTIPDSYSYKNGTYFDEIYFPRTALEMIEGIWPYEITHPPLGKAIISLGIRIFGMTPFGWRFMGTLFGVLMLPVLYVLLKKMFGYTAVAACGSALFAFDFMHYTQTRLATIDTYAVFFILLMYLFMYLWVAEPPDRSRRRNLWLFLCGLSFGLGAASKWTCIYAGAGLAVIWLIYWIIRLRREKKAVRDDFILNIGWCLLFFIAVPCLVYYVSYYSYGVSQGLSGVKMFFSKDYLQIVLDNQSYMWNYHSDLVATHPYSSKWYQWILDIRPILYYLEYFEDGTISSFAAFSNPIVCWGGLCAMIGMGWLAVRDRDKKALFILIGYLANLLPWVLVSRLTFAYHYFPCTVFLVLALARIFEDLRRRDGKWRAAIGSFTAVSVAMFVMFYPVLSGVRRSATYSNIFLKWFTDTWPF
ncbi:MAG: glycosyltransferase family 39 protein [Oscillospiraceae bacterium]|nr:glycosyltransferase family 39 protein [Oscillospiraceae bacterium]